MDRLPSERDNPSAGRRSHSRLRVRLPARLTTLGGTSSAILTDLSFGGAKLFVKRAVAPGQEGLLTWDRFEAFGVVNWAHDGMCGLHFEEMVPPMVLIATRDLDDFGHLPDEREMAREGVREWVEGSVRW